MWPSLANLVDNTLYEGLTYAPIALSMLLSYRLLQFPDITMEGSFILGAAVTATLTVHLGVPVALALAAGVAAGALAGVFTMFLVVCCRIDKLLAGVLSSFVCYSLSLLIMGGYVAYGTVPTLLVPFESLDRDARQYLPDRLNLHVARILAFGTIAGFLKLFIDAGLRTEKGLVMTAIGLNERSVVHIGINPVYYKFFGLAAANALVALTGALVTMKEGSASATRGIGLIIFALTAYVVGERLIRPPLSDAEVVVSGAGPCCRLLSRLARLRRRCELSTGAILGAIFYFFVLQLAYILGIRPELPKLLMGCYIIVVVGDRTWLRTLARVWRRRNA